MGEAQSKPTSPQSATSTGVHHDHVPRRPQQSLLHRTVAQAWPQLLRRTLERGGAWPQFVTREFDKFLCCGVLEHGFIRLYCQQCRLDRLVPFSCKGRGFCPSCGARRMAAAAAHLTDEVIPRVPTRQWVLSLPFDLRYRLAFHRPLCAAVRALFARTVIALQRRCVGTSQGITLAQLHGGAATWTQRFGDGLRLNIHFHAIVLCGAFVHRGEDQPAFVPARDPTAQDLRWVTERVVSGVQRLLAGEGPEDDGTPPGLQDEPTLAACATACSHDRIALSEPGAPRIIRLGRPNSRVQPAVVTSDDRCLASGFNLHAGPCIGGNDRRRLERLCRYVSRPALSEARLEEHQDGRIIFHLKRVWSDGTHALLLRPLELVERLALMVPPPRAHGVTYHGVLSSHSALRARIVPDGARPSGRQGQPPLSTGDLHASPDAKPRPRASAGLSWAGLMQRVFAIDVLECPRCGHRSEIISTICDSRVIAAFLEVWCPPTGPP